MYSFDVPQGYVLGPSLFLLHINDTCNPSDLLDFHIFADDSNLSYANKSLLQKSTVNDQLKFVHQWLCPNKLSLIIEKSNFVIFYPSQKPVPFSVKLTLNNEELIQVKYIQYLGVNIDCHLSWKAHVSYVTNKIECSIGIISKLRHFVSIEIIINLYYALIYPS